MMGRALLIVGWMATLGFVGNGILGYWVESRETLSLHLLVGLVSCLLLLFSHCWILFYLIGTGKAIKEAVQEHQLDEDAVALTRQFKNQSNPPLMVAMILAMVTFIVGGGILTGQVAVWLHHGLFWLAALAQLWALGVEHRVLVANEALMQRVGRAAGGEAGATVTGLESGA